MTLQNDVMSKFAEWGRRKCKNEIKMYVIKSVYICLLRQKQKQDNRKKNE